MLRKKIFPIIFSVIFVGGLVLGAPNILALTPDEIKEMIDELQTQVLYFQAQLDQLQKELAKIQKPEEEAKIEETPATCHTFPLWDWYYCSSKCKCNAGEGDCDGDFQCNTGYCALDVGAKYGQNKWLDVCEEKKAVVTKPVSPPVVSPPVVSPPVISPPSKPEEPPAPTCNDSDWFGTDEKNYKKRLITEGSCEDETGSYPDVCLDEDMLRDYSCSLTRGGRSACFPTYYSCKNLGFIGCKNGTCFKTGALSLSLAEDNPSSQNILPGTKDVAFLKAKFVVSEGEDVKVNSLKACLSGSSQLSFDIKLYKGEGEGTDVLVASAQTESADNCATFSVLNWIIPKSTSKTLTIKTDIPTEIDTPVTLSMEIKIDDLRAVGLTSEAALSVSGSATGNPMTVTVTLTVKTPEVLCADSDSGINEYVFGKITAQGGVTYSDACFLGDNLKEWVCTVSGAVTYKLIECEAGCIDGVCKKAGGNDNLTGVVCVDSDAGRDYETFGEVIHGTGDLIDEDTCQSESILRENFCENGYFKSETFECSSGCLNGACLSQTGLKNVENNLAFIAKGISQLMERVKELTY